MYKFTLVEFFIKNGFYASAYQSKIIFVIRFLILLILSLLIARPQLVDVRSKVNVEGIDIIMALDVSGSMNSFDDINDKRSRFEIAKDEAIRFIKKRENDAIGLVIFGGYAITRCPLTLDKKILNEIINQLEIGELNPNETVLSIAILNSLNRLKNSYAKNKIIILLTDGAPSLTDINPSIAIDVAKKMGIKIYTIGIGNENGGLINHPFLGIVPCGASLNKELLMNISSQTGGKFFQAKNSNDMRKIYEEINSLEKTKYETTVYNRYYELYIPLIILALLLIFIELILTTFVWFAL